MQGIITKYLGPTNTLPSRIKVSTTGGRSFRITVPYNSALSTYENHKAAALILASKLGWYGEWFECDNAGSGYVFVRVIYKNEPSFVIANGDKS
jgi:hypothetical protein